MSSRKGIRRHLPNPVGTRSLIVWWISQKLSKMLSTHHLSYLCYLLLQHKPTWQLMSASCNMLVVPGLSRDRHAVRLFTADPWHIKRFMLLLVLLLVVLTVRKIICTAVFAKVFFWGRAYGLLDIFLMALVVSICPAFCVLSYQYVFFSVFEYVPVFVVHNCYCVKIPQADLCSHNGLLLSFT